MGGEAWSLSETADRGKTTLLGQLKHACIDTRIHAKIITAYDDVFPTQIVFDSAVFCGSF